MIVSFYRYGRLGNRLFTFANLISFSESHNVPLLMPAFSEYSAGFPFFRNNSACAYGFRQPKPPGYPTAVMAAAGARVRVIPTVRFWEGRYVYFDGEDAGDQRVQTMITAPAVIFEGWDFCSRRAILQFRERIRSVFSPRTEIMEHAARFRAQLLERGDVVVGVHVRWGDYRGTERFFDLPDYLQRMDEIRDLLFPSTPVFAVFSPEAIPADALPADGCVCSSGVLEDLYSLAECDYIVGPPSTFSMWASYYGGHPLFVMKKGARFLQKSMAAIATP